MATTLDKYLPYADNKTPEAMAGTWALVAPDGTRYEAARPTDCLIAEVNARVPPEVALGRIARAMNDDPPETDAETAAYAEGRSDQRADDIRLLAWAYRKLMPYSFSKQEDALSMDEIKLMLDGAQ